MPIDYISKKLNSTINEIITILIIKKLQNTKRLEYNKEITNNILRI